MGGVVKIGIRLAVGIFGAREVQELGQGVIDPQEPARAVLEVNAVGYVLEQRLEQIALAGQFVFRGDALDRVAHRAEQQVGIDAALDQIVLRAAMYGLHAEFLILALAQDDEWQMRRGLVGSEEGFQAATVGQIQVQEHEIEAADIEQVEAARQRARDLGHAKDRPFPARWCRGAGTHRRDYPRQGAREIFPARWTAWHGQSQRITRAVPRESSPSSCASRPARG